MITYLGGLSPTQYVCSRVGEDTYNLEVRTEAASTRLDAAMGRSGRMIGEGMGLAGAILFLGTFTVAAMILSAIFYNLFGWIKPGQEHGGASVALGSLIMAVWTLARYWQ